MATINRSIGPAAFGRRNVLKATAAGTALPSVGINPAAAATTERPVESHRDAPVMANCTLTVNGRRSQLPLDSRMTLLDALRHKLGLTGTKKGCDHGQ